MNNIIKDNTENFNVVANQKRENSGFYYDIKTEKDKKYKFVIGGFLKTGTKAVVYCVNDEGVSLISKDNFFYELEEQTYSFEMISDGSNIRFGALFKNKNVRNVLKVNYVLVMDENLTLINKGEIKLLNRSKIYYYENMNYTNIYFKFLELKKKIYILLNYNQDINEKDIFGIFDNTYGKILIKPEIKIGYYDEKEKIFVLPENRYKSYLSSINEEIYHFRY